MWLRGSHVSLPTLSMQNFCGPLLPVGRKQNTSHSSTKRDTPRLRKGPSGNAANPRNSLPRDFIEAKSSVGIDMDNKILPNCRN